MFIKFINWLRKFQYRRQAQRYLEAYEEVAGQGDRTKWLELFDTQSALLNSDAFKNLYINQIDSGQVYVYGDLEDTLKEYRKFLSQLQRNNAINVTDLQEFQINSSSQSLHAIFKPSVNIKEQLAEFNVVLNNILIAYNKQTGSMKTMNLSRIIVLFELFSIIVQRVTVGYIIT